ncbi:lipoprotein [Thalassolituus sp.]|jgi:predicted small lipoprotein YifL|nr:lipoprotein [uncultured Thalassolituus sp.]TNC92329.1 MAG: hypothetical protein CSH36_05125 [Thalassolituus sp.]
MRLVFLTVVMTCLSACGQKGPLYLPDTQQEQPQQDHQG